MNKKTDFVQVQERNGHKGKAGLEAKVKFKKQRYKKKMVGLED